MDNLSYVRIVLQKMLPVAIRKHNEAAVDHKSDKNDPSETPDDVLAKTLSPLHGIRLLNLAKRGSMDVVGNHFGPLAIRELPPFLLDSVVVVLNVVLDVVAKSCQDFREDTSSPEDPSSAQ